MNRKIGHIFKVFELLCNEKVNRNQFKVEYESLLSMCNDRSLLIREKFALNSVLNYNYEKFYDQLSLGYIYGGMVYSTSKAARKEDSPVASTEILISLKLNIKEWDRMGQVWLYNDGTQFEHIKDEILTKGIDGLMY